MMLNFSCILISGADAVSFLQGQLTADLSLLSPTQASLAAHLSREGRVQSLFLVIKKENSFHLWLPSESHEKALTLLKKYALFSKVAFTSLNHRFLSLIKTPSEYLAQFENASLFASHESGEMLYINLPHPQYCLLESNKLDETEKSLSTWIDLEIPWILPETHDLFFPHDLNLPKLNAVSFKKGCYLGQEIVARMEFRGKLKRHLAKWLLPFTPWQLGNALSLDEIHTGKVVLAAPYENSLKALVVTQ